MKKKPTNFKRKKNQKGIFVSLEKNIYNIFYIHKPNQTLKMIKEKSTFNKRAYNRNVFFKLYLKILQFVEIERYTNDSDFIVWFMAPNNFYDHI